MEMSLLTVNIFGGAIAATLTNSEQLIVSEQVSCTDISYVCGLMGLIKCSTQLYLPHEEKLRHAMIMIVIRTNVNNGMISIVCVHRLSLSLSLSLSLK